MGNNDDKYEENKTRINKFISHNSRFSRREADELIKAGKVSIEGKVIGDLSTKVGYKTIVKVNGRTVKVDFNRASTVIIYNKLKGEIVSKNDPQGRKIIYDTISKKFSHFISIGRLDYASEGLLLLTDDPSIATALMTSNLERVYKVKITATLMDKYENRIINGIYVHLKEPDNNPAKSDGIDKPVSASNGVYIFEVNSTIATSEPSLFVHTTERATLPSFLIRIGLGETKSDSSTAVSPPLPQEYLTSALPDSYPYTFITNISEVSPVMLMYSFPFLPLVPLYPDQVMFISW